MRCSIIPPYLLDRLAASDSQGHQKAAEAARGSLHLESALDFRAIRADEQVARRGLLAPVPEPGAFTERELQGPQRTIYTANNTEDLPGDVVREEDGGASGDPAIDEAYDGLGSTHELFREVYARASINDSNLPLLGTVHFGVDYDNAFWDGERMVFGDGDDEIFVRMTASLSVIGHELTHGVTQFSAGLKYEGQAGALNESVSDVFGVLVEQYVKGESVDQATWLIGAGLFTDAVQGDALRSLKAPGTAYDDDVLGKDPQPSTMSGYVETTEDYGGVHLNSGIPNHAFYLAAVEIGGNAWEKAGLVWYDTITGGALAPDSDFSDFATATVGAAAARYGGESPERAAVLAAWDAVGIAVRP